MAWERHYAGSQLDVMYPLERRYIEKTKRAGEVLRRSP